jgi:maltose/moltooligosaccharide transporter
MLIGATPEQLPILNIAGPITGLFIQPLIGAISDKSWHDRWGRRKPFILGGALLAAVVLIFFPFVGVLWAAVLCLWLLDIGNNTTAEPYRA